MKYRRVFSRRNVLRGAGVAVALPFIEEMSANSALAADSEPKNRMVTIFFGNGFPPDFVADGIAGPMAPFAAVANKVAVYGKLDLNGTGFGHPGGGYSAFVGKPAGSGGRAGGPSIEQFTLKRVYPNGAPTRLQSVAAGLYFRNGDPWRHIHSWREDGAPAAVPIRDPGALWDQLFKGGAVSKPDAKPDPAVEARRRVKKSILDAVMGDYAHFTSAAGGLGKRSQAFLKDHLDRVRELEKQLSAQPTMPAPGTCTPGQRNGVAGITEAIPTFAPAELIAHWKLLSDIFVMGLHCDVFRFGSLVCQGASDRMFLKGPYDYNGTAMTFAHTQDHHELWHGHQLGSRKNRDFMGHLHVLATKMVHTLKSLDDPMYKGENGKTFLENHLVMITTELGQHGASEDGNHSMKNAFHLISGAGGRLKTGVWDTKTEGMSADLYAACVRGLGIASTFGNASSGEQARWDALLT